MNEKEFLDRIERLEQKEKESMKEIEEMKKQFDDFMVKAEKFIEGQKKRDRGRVAEGDE